jgi:hypothetical protein
MQTFCSIVAAILVLATPGECKTPTDSVTSKTGATNVHYVRNGLPELPRLPSVPRLPRVPKPKWP